MKTFGTPLCACWCVLYNIFSTLLSSVCQIKMFYFPFSHFCNGFPCKICRTDNVYLESLLFFHVMDSEWCASYSSLFSCDGFLWTITSQSLLLPIFLFQIAVTFIFVKVFRMAGRRRPISSFWMTVEIDFRCLYRASIGIFYFRAIILQFLQD